MRAFFLDLAAFFAMVGRRWTLVRKDPAKLNTALRELQGSPAYANHLKQPAGWVADPLSPLAGRLPGNASAATSAEGLGKGGKGAFPKNNLKKTAARRGKSPKGTGAPDSEDA